MEYQHRFEKIIKFIGQHLDDQLTLDELSSIACFSKYHFHRLFTVYTGLSLKQYIRWLRLKRAAQQLIVEPDKSIINIAIDAGFESHEAFTRAFKQAAGQTPSVYRISATGSVWDKSPYGLSYNKGEKMIDVTIKNMPARRLAVVEHRGASEKLGESIQKLVKWTKLQPISLKLQAGETFGFAYDDPKTTEPTEFRFDLGISLAEHLKLDSEIIEKRLPAGRYATAMHRGSRDTINDTVYALYRDWLPTSGEELGDLPCIFCYHNFDHEVAETEYLTECWLLLK